MENSGYFRSPSLSGEKLIFVSDDDIWSVSSQGGLASRLTTCRGRAQNPKVSPDGKWIVYEGNDSGQMDLYLMPAEGGSPKRITYRGDASLSRWTSNSKLIYSSADESFNLRRRFLYQIDVFNYKETRFDFGPASYYEKGPGKKAILGRNLGDPARWKRYRGGTAGTLWLDSEGKGDFKQILKNLKSNLTCPKWIENRIYFISDHEGIGNIYSCNSQGTNIKRHTHQEEFYVRNFSQHNGQLAYQTGADIFLLDLGSDVSSKVAIEFHSFCLQAQDRFEESLANLQDYNLCPESNQIALAIRGKLFIIPPWGGAPIQLGDARVRYKYPTWRQTDNGKQLLAVAMDQDHEEHLVYFSEEGYQEHVLVEDHDWGKIQCIVPSPTTDILAIITNRNELKLVDLQEHKVQLLEKAPNYGVGGLNWSADGRYLAYQMPLDHQLVGIKIYDFDRDEARLLFDPINADTRPVFSQCGKYLFFNGVREYHPTHSETHNEITFPFASKAYAVILQKDGVSPLDEFLGLEIDDDSDDSEGIESGQSDELEDEDVVIDFENIGSRIVSIPLGMGGIRELIAAKDRLLYIKKEIGGTDPFKARWEELPFDLYSYCFKDQKNEIFHKDVDSFTISEDGKHILIDSAGELRLLSMEAKPTEGEEFNKKDGWIDFERIKVRHHPRDEWFQMYQEAWILQREHFWVDDMSKVDWEEIYARYLPLLDKVNTRSEFSDLIWEMQGELGTSHCYEMEGDYHRSPPQNHIGKLGAEFSYDSDRSAFKVERIYQGDSWIEGAHSPLDSHRANLKSGDFIHAVDGQFFDSPLSLNQMLEGKAKVKVNLLIQRKDQKEKESICVDTLSTNSFLLYREWVEQNKVFVHKKSGGKLGYIHIPDMSYRGFAEFYRHFLSERLKDGLIIDVRFNGGGNVSQHILKILAQKQLGFDRSRHFGYWTFPEHAVRGPMVALTNELAGSDGDIFSHSFKMMNLGKLVGKRTWGGVIGIWPRHFLNDGTWTSQAEFSFWFKDVGYGVENYGTDPDVDVDISPKDWKQTKDSQLEKSIEIALKDLKKSPPMSKPTDKERVSLKLPKLPR